MDPDQALADIREAIEVGDYQAACDRFSGLDNWLTRGGFPPEAWIEGPPETPSPAQQRLRLVPDGKS